MAGHLEVGAQLAQFGRQLAGRSPVRNSPSSVVLPVSGSRQAASQITIASTVGTIMAGSLSAPARFARPVDPPADTGEGGRPRRRTGRPDLPRATNDMVHPWHDVTPGENLPA